MCTPWSEREEPTRYEKPKAPNRTYMRFSSAKILGRYREGRKTTAQAYFWSFWSSCLFNVSETDAGMLNVTCWIHGKKRDSFKRSSEASASLGAAESPALPLTLVYPALLSASANQRPGCDVTHPPSQTENTWAS